MIAAMLLGRFGRGSYWDRMRSEKRSSGIGSRSNFGPFSVRVIPCQQNQLSSSVSG
jgi:hypothetical protein